MFSNAHNMQFTFSKLVYFSDIFLAILPVKVLVTFSIVTHFGSVFDVFFLMINNIFSSLIDNYFDEHKWLLMITEVIRSKFSFLTPLHGPVFTLHCMDYQ